jgi:hypothetical protein
MSDEKKAALNELAPPPGAYGHGQASEILRAWITANGLEVSMTGVWDEPDNWGILLVDLARHAARIFEDQGICNSEAAMARIVDMFHAELQHPTDPGRTAPAAKQ